MLAFDLVWARSAHSDCQVAAHTQNSVTFRESVTRKVAADIPGGFSVRATATIDVVDRKEFISTLATARAPRIASAIMR